MINTDATKKALKALLVLLKSTDPEVRIKAAALILSYSHS